MNKNNIKVNSKTKAFYEEKYSRGEEIQRTSKLYTLACIPPVGNLAVLDVGCGSGINSRIITDMGHSVIGVDISEHAIHKYRNRGFNGFVMDIEQGLEFSDATFDMVFCSEVIEHLVNPENLVKEIYRVLRPEGKLLLSTPNSAFWVYRAASLLGYTLSELQHPKHFIFFSRRSLRQLVQKEGFLPISETGRNMYAILPDPKMDLLRRLLSLLGFRQEMRFRTGSSFWHLSHHSGFLNSFFSDTLILMAKKPDLKEVVG